MTFPATQDCPQMGGDVVFSPTGVGTCMLCGWRGAPTIREGIRQSYCPACQPPPDEPVKKPARNAPCPCGSGRKSKKCCFG